MPVSLCGTGVAQALRTVSADSRGRTQTFFLPGQKFTVGVPWDREALPPPAPMVPQPSTANPFDTSDMTADPCAGLEIGRCQVVRRLSTASANSMLAVRTDPHEGTALVALRALELPESGVHELLEHARWAARFRHSNLARVYGCEVTDEGIFWVTEFAAGATLSEISASCRKIGKAVPFGFALSAAYEAALALAELHEPGNHAHGFVSDETIFVSFDGVTKLVDLGLFRCIAGKILRPGGLDAMAPYLAPEQVATGRLPDPKSDVYSLAAVLHECLSGQKPRNGFEQRGEFVPPSSYNVALGTALDAVLLKALQTDRSKRYRSATEFALDLKAASYAFMWRAQQRAEFVSQLFQARKRREQVLLAGCEEILWAPKPAPRVSPPVAPMPASELTPPPPTQSMRVIDAPPTEPASFGVKTRSMRALVAPQPKSLPPAPIAKTKRRASLRPKVLALVASLLALTYERGAVDPFVNDLPSSAPEALPRVAVEPKEPQPEVPVPATVTPDQAPPPPGASVVAANQAREPAVAPKKDAETPTLEPARSVVAGRQKTKRSSRKKDDAPLPPWLAPHGPRR